MTSRLTSFTTTHRVINRVHNYTTVVRTTTHPARATGLTRAFESVVRVAYTTYSSFASTKNLTSFTRRQLDNAVVTFTRSQLCEVTSRANQEGALAWTKLDVVDKVVRLLTVITMTVVLLGLLTLTLIYLSFGAAFALADLIGSLTIGFCIVAAVYLFILILFVIFRHKWIERPLVRFLASLLMEK